MNAQEILLTALIPADDRYDALRQSRDFATNVASTSSAVVAWSTAPVYRYAADRFEVTFLMNVREPGHSAWYAARHKVLDLCDLHNLYVKTCDLAA